MRFVLVKPSPLLGPNGSGKSTSIKCGLGIQSPQKGTIEKIAKDELGYVPQTSEFPEQVRGFVIWFNWLQDILKIRQMKKEVMRAFGVRCLLEAKCEQP